MRVPIRSFPARAFARVAAAALAALVAGGCAALPSVDAGPAFPGRYEDLSQSDWPLAVELDASGNAIVEYAWWDARAGETRTRRRSGTWEIDAERVLLHYDGVTDVLAPRRSLLDETGVDRGAGFENVGEPDRRSAIGASRLWKTDGTD